MYRFLCIAIMLLSNLLAQDRYNNLPPQLLNPTPHEVNSSFNIDKSFYQRKTDWQTIIDTTWGPGLPQNEKLNIFNTFVNTLDKQFPLFPNLSFDWDSLKSHYYSQITSATSRGRFASIMSNLAYKLRDVHTYAKDNGVLHTPLNPGIPILVIGANGGNHFGAALTVDKDTSIIVLKVVDNHPLGLQPGDEILGYEGAPWKILIEELLKAELPITGFWGGAESAYYDAKMKCAGMNWHLFETIDIKKYSGEIVSLPLSSMLSLSMDEFLLGNEQLEVKNIPFPTYNGRTGTTVSYGKLENSNIGYIYLIAELLNQSDQELYNAVNDLSDTDGLIIDMRYNSGGSVHVSFHKAFNILFNSSFQTFESYSRCSASDWNMCSDGLTYRFNINADNDSFYEKPIAILVGPGCGSMGDIILNRFMYHPNVRLFGKSPMASLSFSHPLNEFDGWSIRYATSDMRRNSDPKYSLCQKEVHIEYPVWFTKDDIANGYDTVLEEAKEYVSSAIHTYNPTLSKIYSDDDIIFSSKVFNPSSQSVLVTAEISNNGENVDSKKWTTHGTQVIESLNTTQLPKGIYNLSIITKGIRDTATHTLPNILRFTNTGPVEVKDFYAYIWNNKLVLKNITLMNKSTERTIPNVKVDLSCEDSSIINISRNISFGNMNPQEVRTIDASVFVKIRELKNYKFVAQISSNNNVYWHDTLYYNSPVYFLDNLTMPIDFSLKQNYPNPFNPSTTIIYSIPRQSFVLLKVFDLLGKEVATLVDNEQEAGYHRILFSSKEFNLSSGIYLCTLKAGRYTETRKMILLK